MLEHPTGGRLGKVMGVKSCRRGLTFFLRPTLVTIASFSTFIIVQEVNYTASQFLFSKVLHSLVAHTLLFTTSYFWVFLF